jgi:hypothetical protein
MLQQQLSLLDIFGPAEKSINPMLFLDGGYFHLHASHCHIHKLSDKQRHPLLPRIHFKISHHLGVNSLEAKPARVRPENSVISIHMILYLPVLPLFLEKVGISAGSQQVDVSYLVHFTACQHHGGTPYDKIIVLKKVEIVTCQLKKMSYSFQCCQFCII